MSLTAHDSLHETIHIELSEAPRHYDILIGEALLHQAGHKIAERLGKRRCVIITDMHVAPILLPLVEAVLASAGHEVLPSIVMPPGEATKSFLVLHDLMNHLYDRAIDRQTLLIALGGGVIGDLVGFAASITLRGIDFVQMPTTLLAQVDSSVGGKTGINSLYGKNTIGTFYQPRLVLIDVTTLDSLPERDLLGGYAEIVKYGLIQDRAFFDWCQSHGGRLLFGDASTRITAIFKSCSYKAALVAQDEKESGARALLNLGHTFGHALEGVAGYSSDKLHHGEAVSIGMVLAFCLSAKLGLCSEDEAKEVHDHLYGLGLPVTPPEMKYDIDELMAFMAHDKKAKNGKLVMILTRGIGKCFIAENVDPQAVRSLWTQVLRG